MKNLTDNPKNERKRKPLQERVNAYEARLPGHLFNHKWIKEIRACTYPLIGVLAITRDWQTNIWRGREPELAEVLGISDRQVRNQLGRLKKLELIQIRRFPYTIEVHICERLLPKHEAPHARATRVNRSLQKFRGEIEGVR